MVWLLWEADYNMALKKKSEAIEKAVNRLLEEDDANNPSDPHCYSRAIFSAFEKIAPLREKGIGYARICKAFESFGLLPENADPHSLGQAFRREKARREKYSAKTPPSERSDRDTAKKAAASPWKADKSIAKTAPEAAEAGNDATEKEWIRKLTGTTVDTELGKIIKHSDGSFEVL
jgi:hypothetical protein